MKEKLNKKNNINYIHYLQYTEVIVLEKQINSSTIAYLLIYSASNITYLSGHGQRMTYITVAHLDRYSITKIIKLARKNNHIRKWNGK